MGRRVKRPWRSHAELSKAKRKQTPRGFAPDAPHQQIRQPGEAGRHHSGFVAHEPLRCQATLQIVLEVEVAQRLPAGVVDDEGLGALLDGPWRGEASMVWHVRFYAEAIFVSTGSFKLRLAGLM